MERVITYDSLPSAMGLLLAKVDRLEKLVEGGLYPKKEPETTAGGRRIATAKATAEYLNRPVSALYQMQHKGIISGVKMPGSRRLYFDLDQIDNTFKNVTVTA